MMAKDIEQVVFGALQRHGLSRSLCVEAARAVRVATEDAAKGGEAKAWCDGCHGLVAVTTLWCPACAKPNPDAEDAAKYRAAVERAKDADALARVYHEGQTDGSHRVALMDVATHVLGLDAPTGGTGGTL